MMPSPMARLRPSLSPVAPASPEVLCAAYWADLARTPPGELPWTGCDVQRLLEVLRKNKVPLLSLPELAASLPIRNDPLFQAALQTETAELIAPRAEYKLVHEALAAQGVAGVLIKSVGLQPSFPFKSDNLDVLYRPGDVDRVRSTLLQLGYVELTNMEEPHKYLFRKFHAGRSVSAIHLHEHVGWMTSFLDEERLWQRCRPAADDPWITIPAPEDALLTTLAHWFYEDKRLTLQDVLKCAHCLRQGVDWDEVYRIASWRGWRDGLNVALLLVSYQETALYGQTLVPSSVLEGAWRGTPSWAQKRLQRYTGASASTAPAVAPMRISFLFSKAFSYAKLWRDPSRSRARRLRDLIVHTAYGIKLRLHIRSQPAMLITFSGVDGCGKTTQAHALRSAFETCHLQVNYTWNRGGSAGWIALLNRLLKRGTGSVQPDNPASPQLVTTEEKVRSRQQQVRSPWKRWGWSWLTTVELLLQYTWRVTLPLLRGRVVICDRYVNDALADWSAYFGEEAAEKRLAARVLRALIPRPDRAYWLDVPAEMARSRSADGLPARFLDAQSALYGRLAAMGRKAGPSLQRLDGTQGWQEISDQVVHDVLSDYFSDYWTLVNTLFLKNPEQWR